MNARNYQVEMERELETVSGMAQMPRLLLHSCCAPCSSYVLECLFRYFDITVFYYNPNIYPDEEYEHRVKEQQEFLIRYPFEREISFMAGEYDKERFYDTIKGTEDFGEGTERCFRCYRLRLEETAKRAKDGGFDYFTTTLSISPMKNAAKLNEIGEETARSVGVRYLTSDFKKKNGYKRSCEISKEYGMYRQDYCGCIYSYGEREKQKKEEAQSDRNA